MPEQLPDGPAESAMAELLGISADLVNVSSKVLRIVRRLQPASRRLLADQTDMTFTIETGTSDAADSMVEKLSAMIGNGALSQKFEEMGWPRPTVLSEPSIEAVGSPSNSRTSTGSDLETHWIAIITLATLAFLLACGFIAYRLSYSKGVQIPTWPSKMSRTEERNHLQPLNEPADEECAREASLGQMEAGNASIAHPPHGLAHRPLPQEPYQEPVHVVVSDPVSRQLPLLAAQQSASPEFVAPPARVPVDSSQDPPTGEHGGADIKESLSPSGEEAAAKSVVSEAMSCVFDLTTLQESDSEILGARAPAVAVSDLLDVDLTATSNVILGNMRASHLGSSDILGQGFTNDVEISVIGGNRISSILAALAPIPPQLSGEGAQIRIPDPDSALEPADVIPESLHSKISNPTMPRADTASGTSPESSPIRTKAGFRTVRLPDHDILES